MDEVWCHDGIEISRLSLDKPHCIGTDAWGRRKEQPVLVSVRFAFRNGFDSAAQTDSLDQSTVNYGQASKRIKAIKSVAPWESLDDFCKRLYQVVLDCLPGPRTIESCLLRVHLPKASLLGSEVIVSSGYQHLVGMAWPKLERTLQLHRIHVPILVGINEHERKQKQPLIFSLSLQDVPATVLDAYSRIEESLYQIIEDTCFETLESLALFVVHRLNEIHFSSEARRSTVRLRIEKPMAVPSADAPCIEIVRTPMELSRAAARVMANQNEQALRIVRPYSG